MFDLSQFGQVYDGDDCSSLSPVEWEIKEIRDLSQLDKDEDLETHLAMYTISQSRKYYENEWTVTSFDMVIGNLGGFSGLVWSVIVLIVGPYEAFKYSASLVSEIYPTKKSQVGRQNINDAKSDLKDGLDTLSKYHYSYLDMLFASLISKVCCCFKRAKCYKKREARLKRH